MTSMHRQEVPCGPSSSATLTSELVTDTTVLEDTAPRDTVDLPPRSRGKGEVRILIAEYGHLAPMDLMTPVPTAGVRVIGPEDVEYMTAVLGSETIHSRETRTDPLPRSAVSYLESRKEKETKQEHARMAYEDDFTRFIQRHHEMSRAKTALREPGIKDGLPHCWVPTPLGAAGGLSVEMATTHCKQSYHRLVVSYTYLARLERHTWPRESECRDMEDEYLGCFEAVLGQHFGQSVPIEWAYAGSAAGELKLVFTAAAATTPRAVSSSASVPQSSSAASSTPTPAVSRTPSTPAVASSSVRPSASTVPTTTPTSGSMTPNLRRRAVTSSSAFTKTVTTVPLSYTSIGWAPIALPSGSYDLAAYLVPASSGETERVVGTLKGVTVVQGSDDSCLSSSGSVQSSTSNAAGATTSGSQASTGIPASGESTVDSSSSINKNENTSNKGPIIGGVVGAVLGSALLALLVYFCIIRPRRRRAAGEKETRGVGSAFGWDFGTLGSTTAGGGGVGRTSSSGSRRRTGTAEYPAVSSVSGPISATHVQGFQGYGNPLQRKEQLNGATAFDQPLSMDNHASPHRNGPPPARPVHPSSHLDNNTDYAEKDPEKAFPVRDNAIEMIPVLPRMNTAFIPPAEHDFRRATTTGNRDFFPEQEILASTSPSPVYFDASPFGHDHASENLGGGTTNTPSSQGHENTTTTLSESSHTTGNSHANLMYYSRSQHGTTNPSDLTRRASAVLPDDIFGLAGGGVQRHPSSATTSGSQRRRSAAGLAMGGGGGAGGGVERSTSVRRKPVPPVIVDEYERGSMREAPPPPSPPRRTEDRGGGPPMREGGGGTPAVGLEEGSETVPRGLVKQKSFVLDVDRPLVQ
ncbi:hypothetical protein QFC19_002277 [Naganishia cerealis]|uniref:Uncharacterized protein n=1 Tax=Naganishia cerealis TaxID=610337 RepID=A0ACC2WAX7_9TREE|nr:hypothetical protein QFC19_002277 [Naganishia cerealis]